MKKRIISLILIFIIVFSLFSPTTASAYQITGVDLHCEAAMLVSLDTGDVLFTKNAQKRMYPASITTLLTAVVVIESAEDFENGTITYTKSANNLILGTGSVVLGLKVGEEIAVKDAVAATLVSSCGDAAYALAEHIGGSKEGFAELMNQKAQEIGLTNSHFTNPIGLHDEEHYSTAEDIYILAKYAFSNEFIKKCLSSASYKLGATNMRPEKTIVTSNLMINPNTSVYYKLAVWGKTGFTDEAGRCLVSIASNQGYNYIAVTLGTATPGGVRYEFLDSANMFRWAFNNFEYKSVLAKNTPVAEAKVELSFETDHVTVGLEGGLEALLPKDADSSTIKIKPRLSSDTFKAPIEKGQKMGEADIYYAEEKIGTVNLVATRQVKANGFLIIARSLKDFLTSTVMKIVYVAVALAIIIFTIVVIEINHSKKRHRKVKYKPISKKEIDKE
ncbi:MAG: D-alanyl-D-alanine carboxypeptidase [Clostridia bacterium]|nr:D-alanyl-D-alanine carboxypeptidase [Clostridia bacterium]